MEIPSTIIPITEILVNKNIQLFIKREDLIHPEISGNKYWKLFYNIKNYLSQNPKKPQLITFGGAFSNHIAATAALANDLNIPSLGIIRGEELVDKWQENPTLSLAHTKGMDFRFVTRTQYRDKEILSKDISNEYPEALIVPEGGTNSLAVNGIQHMLNNETKYFDYLCTAVGTGGTLSGIVKYSEEHQKSIGFKAVDDPTLCDRIIQLSGKENFVLMDAHDGRYGIINDELIRFINDFQEKYNIPLDPVYTGKMMKKIFELIDQNYFPKDSKILAFHTGGLQGISGANEMLIKQNRLTINCKI
ncbi:MULTISPECIES: 1-aminocyclopropane-1-carboxylate deaminase/D-cysteine desulfhydrase [Amniculibacterium]|uniref:1-aminocyclopropane-1-carboxylate deaminase/D-cysteine desulfhydrase n=1 Tax=Amniculibacterium TaxID=2715289 RepID=UPI000F5AF004|nr:MULTISPECIES: pyridoxal-phosphate dependent enzyme [Amniculibacterium]